MTASLNVLKYMYLPDLPGRTPFKSFLFLSHSLLPFLPTSLPSFEAKMCFF